MALNQTALQTLDSPRLKPLKYSGLKVLTTDQLKMYLATERQELAQLQAEIGKTMAALSKAQVEREATSTPSSNRNYTERQQLVRDIQSVRNQKIAAAGKLQELRRELKQGDINKIARAGKGLYKRIKKENKRKAKEREKQRKKEEKKDKLWNKKNIRKGSVSGQRSHDRFQRFFDSNKWSSKDKDEMRRLMDDTAVYESDEVFQLLSLMESGAFNSMEEAEEFLNDFSNIQKGKQTELQKLNNREGATSESNSTPNSTPLSTEGPGINMTF